MDKFIETNVINIACLSYSFLCKAGGFYKLFQKDATRGVYLYVFHLMIIFYSYIACISIRPLEAYTPLMVDSYAVFTMPLPFECFEPI